MRGRNLALVENIHGPVTDLRLTPDPIEGLAAPQPLPSEGAVATFTGVVRGVEGEEQVSELFYEAYEKMALSEMGALAEEARREFGVGSIMIVHRTGRVRPGEASVFIAVTAKHRAEAFDACELLIDRIKETMPAWKQEVLEDGTRRWVSHP